MLTKPDAGLHSVSLKSDVSHFERVNNFIEAEPMKLVRSTDSGAATTSAAIELPQAKGMTRMDARLKTVNGPSSGEVIAIPPGTLIVGRDEDCHLRPASDFISRHHCVFLLDSSGMRLRDLGSKNGTFVNGRRIPSGEITLLNDDMVSIGELVFQIELQAAAPEGGGAQQGTRLIEGETLGSQPSKPSAATNSEATNSVVSAAPARATFE